MGPLLPAADIAVMLDFTQDGGGFHAISLSVWRRHHCAAEIAFKTGTHPELIRAFRPDFVRMSSEGCRDGDSACAFVSG
jgi:hypothetical protein